MIPEEGKCQGLEDETKERLVPSVFNLAFVILFIYISLETLMLGHVKVHMFLKEDILLFSHIVCLSASHLSSTAWMYSTI